VEPPTWMLIEVANLRRDRQACLNHAHDMSTNRSGPDPMTVSKSSANPERRLKVPLNGD
jgi:hypothetical protein